MPDIRHEKLDTFSVVMSAYCGMSYKIADGVSFDDAKAITKRRVAKARQNGQTVNHLGGNKWEFEASETGMVTDNDGVLEIDRDYRRYRIILGRKIYLD